MAAILPILCFILIFAALCLRGANRRDAAIFAASYWGCILLAITESLSLWRLLASVPLTAAWAAACVVPAALLLRTAPISRTAVPLGESGREPTAIELGDALLSAVIALVVVLVGITALASPPNTWDTIDYHMSRVAMWISNRGVSFFPTLDYVQLVYAPWAEYAMLHFDLLFGSDGLVNLVEFGSFLGTIVCASGIARELGASPRGQILAAAFCATIPTAVLESSGSMNGVVVSFWLAASAFCLMRFATENNWHTLIAAAGACGLSLATKGTAYVFLPAALVASWWLAAPSVRRSFLVRLPVFAISIVLINGTHWFRAYQLTGNPLGVGFSEGGPHLDAAVGRLSARGTIANVVRNIAVDLTISDHVDAYVCRIAASTITLIGANPNDPDYLWRSLPQISGPSRFTTNPAGRQEVFAGNPLHLLLLALALVFTVILIRKNERRTSIYACGVVCAFVLFCALLRWQRWNARLQLPLLVLGAPLIGTIMARYLNRLITAAMAVTLILAALPFALSNELRPLLFRSLSPSNLLTRPFAGNVWTRTRTALYFADQHEDLEDSYVSAAAFARASGCDDVGLDNSFEHYEYPVMALLEVAAGRRHIRYMNVYNATARYQSNHTPPCAVICFACARVPAKWVEYASVGGRVSLFGDVAVFASTGRLRNHPDPAALAASATDGTEMLLLEIDRAFAALMEFRQQSFSRYSALYDAARRRDPSHQVELLKGIYAIERPYWDGMRIRELTMLTRAISEQLRTAAEVASLVAAKQALENFAATETATATAFAALVKRTIGPNDNLFAPRSAASNG